MTAIGEHVSELWGRVPEQTQRQLKKAVLAAAVAFGTVIAAPLLNPLHHSNRPSPHKPETPGHRVHSSSYQGKYHGHDRGWSSGHGAHSSGRS